MLESYRLSENIKKIAFKVQIWIFEPKAIALEVTNVADLRSICQLWWLSLSKNLLDNLDLKLDIWIKNGYNNSYLKNK